MSHVAQIKKLISATNKENGWKAMVMYQDDYANEKLQGEPHNSTHNSRIRKLVSALKKKTECEEY